MIRPVEPTLHTPRTPHRDQTVRGDATENGTDADRSQPRGRMLVPASAPAYRSDVVSGLRQAGPSAAFIAHLFATEAGDPQTRARRTLSADETAMRYAEAIARPGITRDRTANTVVL